MYQPTSKDRVKRNAGFLTMMDKREGDFYNAGLLHAKFVISLKPTFMESDINAFIWLRKVIKAFI